MKYTRGMYMRGVLDGLGVTAKKVGKKHRRDCVTALLGQSRGESGTSPCNGISGARFNPLNTTYDLEPNTDYNSVHVKNYPYWKQGIKATVLTFKLPYYVNVRKAMLNPKASAMDVARAIAASPWGTGQLTVIATESLIRDPRLRHSTWELKVG